MLNLSISAFAIFNSDSSNIWSSFEILLIAFCGIDTPPYQSGTFNATNRHITKRGNKYLRKVGYEVTKSIKSSRPKTDNSVYIFMLKKEAEGKPKRVAKIAGLNKFLRIYYARVKELYN